MSTVKSRPRSTVPVPAPTPTFTSKRRRPIRWAPYLFVLPAVLLELLIHIIPAVAGVFTSLLQLDAKNIRNWLGAPFAGFSNFTFVVNFSNSIGSALVRSFGVTLLYAVIVVAVSWFFGFAAALVLQERFRGRGLLRTIFLIPYAVPAYAGIIIWNFMLQRNNGLINNLIVNDLHLIHNPPFWLLGNDAFVSTAVVAFWRLWPFAFLMTMAGMQSIPDETYESAAIDGAGPWKRTYFITLGMLRPVTAVLLLMMFLWTFNDFNTPFVLFGDSPPTSIVTLPLFIYRNSFINWNFGLGAAMSVLMLVFLLLVTGAWLFFERRRQRA